MSIVDQRQLVSVDWLAGHLDDPRVRVFDCTVHLRPDPPRTYRVESGRADYERAHVPGAGFLDLPGELSDPSSGLAFTMPAFEVLADALMAAGVDQDAHLVLYSTGHPMWATRLWWMLRSLGMDEVGVLDGGFAAWTDAGQATASGTDRPAPGRIDPTPRPHMWADREAVLEAIGDGAVCTLNALSGAVYRGEGDMHYGRRGHITGSVNVPYAQLFDRDSGRWLDADGLRSAFEEVDAFGRRVICYCGGGISATCAAFALSRLGHDDVAVYDGSMGEWVRDERLPMTEGAEPG